MPRGDLMFLAFILEVIDIFSYFIPNRRSRSDGTEQRSARVYATIRSRNT